MKFRIQVKPGEIAPKWYGYSYRDINRYSVTCHPVPLNIIIAWFRNAYLWIRSGVTERDIRVYDLGYRRGYERAMRWTKKHPDRLQSITAVKDIIRELKGAL